MAVPGRAGPVHEHALWNAVRAIRSTVPTVPVWSGPGRSRDFSVPTRSTPTRSKHCAPLQPGPETCRLVQSKALRVELASKLCPFCLDRSTCFRSSPFQALFRSKGAVPVRSRRYSVPRVPFQSVPEAVPFRVLPLRSTSSP